MNRLVRSIRTRAERDDGSALILALVVVVAVGIMMTAVLDFAGTGLTSGIQLRNTRNVNYYAQGAVDGAINQIRGSSTKGLQNKACPDYVPPGASSSIDGATGHTYTVTCKPKGITGAGSQDEPDYAVLTLSSDPSEGLIATGNHNLNIDGGVYSNSLISMQNSTMVINGSVGASGACSPNSPASTGGVVTTTDQSGVQCNLGTAIADPGYVGAVSDNSDLTSLISSDAADPTPTCPDSGVVKFSPGYYTELPGELIKNFAPSCDFNGSPTWWFQPGAYFFNFTGNWYIGPAPCPHNIPCATYVVGGDPTSTTSTPLGFTNWSTGSGTPKDDWTHTNPATGNSYPACKNDVTSSTYDGVQFEFGGASTTSTASQGGIELCGPTADQPSLLPAQPDGTNQHIVFDVLGTGASAANTTTQTFTASAKPTSSGSWTLPLDTSVAQTPDGAFAPAVLGPGDTASMTYTAPFSVSKNAPNQLPDGSKVINAWIRVYQNLIPTPLVGTSPPSATISVTPSDSGASAQTFNVPSTCSGDDTTNYPSSLPYCDVAIDSALVAPEWKDLNGMQVKYTVNGPSGANNSGTAQLDAVALVVKYTAPNADASSCTLASNCVVWDSSVNLDAFLHGTTYAPTAEMDVEVQNRSGTVFDRGVITDSLHVNVSASSTQTAAPFQLPKATPSGRLVLFTGFVDSDMRVRACVLYTDYNTLPDGTKAAFPGYTVTVKSWNVFRGSPSSLSDPSCS